MKIAITGNIGSGKSTISKYLANKGYKVFSCDEYNNYLLNDEEVLKKIKKKFPDAFEDDKLDKKKLAKIIFNNIDEKVELENILHPLIIEEMLKRSNEVETFFAEVPLLFEANLEDYFDTNLLVICDDKITIDRLEKRGLNKEESISRINSQMNIEDKILRAKEIIYNNGNLEQLYKDVDKWLKNYVR